MEPETTTLATKESDETGDTDSSFDGPLGSDEADGDSILPHRRCPDEMLIDVYWNRTDAGVLALRPCPPPYAGSVYRACYSSGAWGGADFSECRLPRLHEVQNLVSRPSNARVFDANCTLRQTSGGWNDLRTFESIAGRATLASSTALTVLPFLLPFRYSITFTNIWLMDYTH